MLGLRWEDGNLTTADDATGDTETMRECLPLPATTPFVPSANFLDTAIDAFCGPHE